MQACRLQDEKRQYVSSPSKDSDEAKTIKVLQEKIRRSENFCRVMAAARHQKAYQNTMLPILMDELGNGRAFIDVVDRVRKRMQNKGAVSGTVTEYKSLPNDKPLYL